MKNQKSRLMQVFPLSMQLNSDKGVINVLRSNSDHPVSLKIEDIADIKILRN
jgi:hypothetical protein